MLPVTYPASQPPDISIQLQGNWHFTLFSEDFVSSERLTTHFHQTEINLDTMERLLECNNGPDNLVEKRSEMFTVHLTLGRKMQHKELREIIY
ncbi:CLUMA_CG001594, isoform A [Clunio marinus]|uniref:CLUMA_CG001594, isoform A n=1 Tax=Clunio marinus TaxID=568069 RepID=A0A1J1HIM4_9DIPT|nr:CLUMA_CG001594, isoform A [Clunio marinus]